MGFFDFLKNKEVTNKNIEFQGRHWQVCFVKQMLGERVSTLEWQIAMNKDQSERNEIIKNLEQLEAYIGSEFFTTQYDVSSTFDKISEINDEGYANCVLQNDDVIEARCIKILKDVIEYGENKANREGILTTEIITAGEKIIEMKRAGGYLLVLPTLGNLLNTADDQHAWFIACSLIYKPNFITHLLASLSREGLEFMVTGISAMKDRLLKSEKISESNANKIDEMVRAGILENREIHKLYPERA